MNKDDYIQLRNFLRTSEEGKLLINYLSDVLTSRAVIPNKSAEQIKGMAEMLHEIKVLPEKVDEIIAEMKE